jgi:threonine/homoserine/homoserine lactone efflux protein
VRVVVGEVLVLALVVTISPLNIIPAILVLFSEKPLITALCFLAGFIAGVATVLGLCVVLAGAVNLSPDSDHSTWAGVLKLVLGVYLLVAAVRKFRGRPRAGEDASMPKWMDGITGYTPGKSLGAGVAFGALNPKNVIVGLAAAVTIASADLSSGQQAAACMVYVFVAILGVAAPILVMVFLGDRAPEVLDDWKTWLGHNSATVMAVLFLIFGVVLIGQGIGTA